MSRRLVLLGAFFAATSLDAQNIHPTPPPEVAAVRLTGHITLDGHLTEAVWQTAPAATGFRQFQPNEGEPATQPTEVRFAYDDEAIYIGARMYDSLGAAGVQTRLGRRDNQPSSDFLEVIFDTYHDHIGRLFFQVNPSGVRSDANGLGGGGDESWDPVWEVKTAIDDQGWTAEMRIPFSQLRYPQTREPQTWGLQIWRQVNRLNETQMWAFWGTQESGGASRFGHLTNLQIQASPERGEIFPYVVGRSTNVPVSDPADPFQNAHSIGGRVGADARVLLNSNLTLNLTVNPDFGQVEVDPAVVNLSAFETFFQERRPFFVEGAGYFSFGGLNCYFCSNVSSLSMFYTRRIGRPPQALGNAYAQGPYVDAPDNSTILGAAKLTGRTPSGWSIGVLDAVTRRENAAVQVDPSTRISVPVEPLTNYFVARVAKDLRDGATVLRGMATSVWRDMSGEPGLSSRLSSHAETFGLSTDWYFQNRNYRLMAQMAGTQVSGDTAVIQRLQQSSARYFQRPDREQGSNGLFSDAYDPTLTSLRGFGMYTRFSREQGHVLWEVQSNLRTPGFENNDIAALSRADYWWMNANVFPQWTRPTSWYRQLFFIAGGQQQYNFDGDLTDRQVQLFGYWQPLNYWQAQIFWIHRFTVDDDRLTRGGPVVQRPGFNYWQASISTDSRKNVVFSVNPSFARTVDHTTTWSANVGITWRPASNISLSLSPGYNYDETSAQYVTAVSDSTATAFFGTRYIFAGITQRTVSMETRLNITFTPNLTLELYAQPFISSGQYYDYKQFAAPRTLTKQVFGRDVGTAVSASTEPDQITIDPDGAGPAAAFTLTDPSFTYRSLRGNAVLRWEYRPGSTLYLVWTRSSSSVLTNGVVDIARDGPDLFRGPADNIFLLKLNYFLGF